MLILWSPQGYNLDLYVNVTYSHDLPWAWSWAVVLRERAPDTQWKTFLNYTILEYFSKRTAKLVQTSHTTQKHKQIIVL